MRPLFAFAILLLFLAAPEASQQPMVKQRIGLTDVTITYHRPLVGSRKICRTIIPFGEGSRARANENTTFEVSDPVLIERQPLQKGTYGLHVVPTVDAWTIDRLQAKQDINKQAVA